jgi:alanine dehydrogenase
MAGRGLEDAMRADAALARGLNTYAGALTSRPVADAHQFDFTPASSVIGGVADAG